MRDVVMNNKTNLLQLEEHFYQLVDVDEPNTFRNLFPYEEIPKIAFNDRIVPHSTKCFCNAKNTIAVGIVVIRTASMSIP